MAEEKGKKGLQKKIIISILVVGALSLLIVLLFISNKGKKTLKNSIGANFKELAKVTSTNIEELINSHIEKAELMSASYTVLSAVDESNQFYEGEKEEDIRNRISEIENRWVNAPGMNAYLLEIQSNKATLYLNDFINKEREKGIHNLVMIINKNGAVVASTKKTPHYYYGDKKWWKSAFAEGRGSLFISDIEREEELGGYTFNIATPIMKGKKAIGVFYMAHNIDIFFKSVTSTKIGDTDHTMLINSDGNVLFCPEIPAKDHHMDPKLIKKVTKDSSGWVSTNWDVHYYGKESINGFAPVKATILMGPDNFGGKKWFILTSQDPDESYAPINTLIRWIAIIGLAGGVLILFLGFLASGKLIKPISELQKGTDMIGRGDLDYRIDINTNDEVEDLARKFNDMALKLKIFYIKLDEKVKERTRELEHKNTELDMLYSMVSTLNRSLGIEEVMMETLKKMIEIMGADSGLIWIVDGNKGRSSITATKGLPSGYARNGNLVKLVNFIGRQVIESGRYWESDNISVDERIESVIYNEERFISLVGVPLTSKKRSIGVLYLFYKDIHALAPWEEKVILPLGSQVGIAVEHALLFAKSKRETVVS
ncbi:MAG: cache domain-containing protein [Nitrospirota bacterium]